MCSWGRFESSTFFKLQHVHNRMLESNPCQTLLSKVSSEIEFHEHVVKYKMTTGYQNGVHFPFNGFWDCENIVLLNVSNSLCRYWPRMKRFMSGLKHLSSFKARLLITRLNPFSTFVQVLKTKLENLIYMYKMNC